MVVNGFERVSGPAVMPKDDSTQEESISVKKAESIDPRPTRNADITHKILSPEIERGEGTGEPQVYGAFVSEKYRDRFLNRPVQNIEKTAEHKIISEEDMQYERGGFVKKKSGFSGTSEFSPVPKLVPDDKLGKGEENSLEKTMVFSDLPKSPEDEKLQKAKTRTIALRSLAVTDGNAHDTELPEEEDDSQLTFEGFHTTEEANEVDEREVEEELNKKRKEKAENFTITGEMGREEAPVKKYGTDEYRTPDDKFKVAYYLRKNKNSSFVCAIISYICFALCITASILVKSFPEAEKLLVENRHHELATLLSPYCEAQLNGELREHKLAIPVCKEVLYAAAVSLVMVGRYWEAERIIAIHEGNPATYTDHIAQLAQLITDIRACTLACEEQRYADAAMLADKWLSCYPLQLNLATFKIEQALREGVDPADLLARTNALLEHYPDSDHLMYLAGRLNTLLGNEETAMEWYTRCAAITRNGLIMMELPAEAFPVPEEPQEESAEIPETEE